MNILIDKICCVLGMAILGVLFCVQTSYAAVIEVGCDTQELIAAIETANSNSEDDELILAESCTYSLTVADNSTEKGGANGLPVISSNINISGNDSTIERSQSASERFRFFQIEETASLSLNDLTLQFGLGSNGLSSVVSLDGSFFGAAPGGGAILTAGDLNLTRVSLLNNQSGDGSNDPDLRVARSGAGGAISSYGASSVSIFNSLIDSNQTGDAFFNYPPGSGGALSIRGDSILIDRTTISNNRVGTSPAAFLFLSSIITAFPTSEFRLLRSTISNNGVGQGQTGMFFNSNALLVIEFSHNTFFNNNSGNSFRHLLDIGAGTASTIIRNNLFEGNGASCQVDAGDLNVGLSTGNIFDVTSSVCGLANGVNGNITGTAANVLPLALNGGRNPTHNLPARSPARDRIGSVPEFVFDQRGSVTYGQDGGVNNFPTTAVDIGAIEAIELTSVGNGLSTQGNMLADASQQDWYSVMLEEGQTIRYTASFVHDLGNIDTFLYDMGDLDQILVQGVSGSNNETIEFTAPKDGEYWFVVFPASDESNSYDLTVSVDRNDELCFPIPAANGSVAVVCL